jgi:hypothetical protein
MRRTFVRKFCCNPVVVVFALVLFITWGGIHLMQRKAFILLLPPHLSNQRNVDLYCVMGKLRCGSKRLAYTTAAL